MKNNHFSVKERENRCGRENTHTHGKKLRENFFGVDENYFEYFKYVNFIREEFLGDFN